MLSCRSPPPPPLTLSATFSTTAVGNGRHHHSLFLPSLNWKNPNLLMATGSGGGGGRGAKVRCMATDKRVKMVAKQIRRELADMLITDKVLQHAVLPESLLGADLYLSSVTTISDVEVSRDLQVAKVYVSVFGDERGKEVAIAGLKRKTKYVRSQLGKRMRLRMTPEIRFIQDDSLERGSRVIAILDRLKEERERQRVQDEDDEDVEGDEQLEPPNSSEEDEDEYEDGEDDDQDEGIIYID